MVLEEFIELHLVCSVRGEVSPPSARPHAVGIDWSGQDQRVGIAASQHRLRFVSIRGLCSAGRRRCMMVWQHQQQGCRNLPKGILTLTEHAPPEEACSLLHLHLHLIRLQLLVLEFGALQLLSFEFGALQSTKEE